MIKEILQGEVRQALRNLSLTVDVSNIEVTKSEHFGDYATNAALVIAKSLGKKPMEFSEELKEELLKSPAGKHYIKDVSIAKPGFINFFLSEEMILGETEALGEHIGKEGVFFFQKKKNKKIKYRRPPPNSGGIFTRWTRGEENIFFFFFFE